MLRHTGFSDVLLVVVAQFLLAPRVRGNDRKLSAI
jgi:hypothetical protein